MPIGTISKYFPNEGYGLIVTKEGTELFFYTKDLEEQCGGEIKEGEQFEFDPSKWNHYQAVHLSCEHQDLEKKLGLKP